jgi:hypothetical protein
MGLAADLPEAAAPAVAGRLSPCQGDGLAAIRSDRNFMENAEGDDDS